jgi:hypothetical protein
MPVRTIFVIASVMARLLIPFNSAIEEPVQTEPLVARPFVVFGIPNQLVHASPRMIWRDDPEPRWR